MSVAKSLKRLDEKLLEAELLVTGGPPPLFRAGLQPARSRGFRPFRPFRPLTNLDCTGLHPRGSSGAPCREGSASATYSGLQRLGCPGVVICRTSSRERRQGYATTLLSSVKSKV